MAMTDEELARLYETVDMAHGFFSAFRAQRSALIAWQFQAGSAELRLQRLINAVQNMREAQTTFENMVPADNYDVIPPELRQAACAMGDAEDALEGMLAVLLADVSAVIGGHHD